MSILWAGNLANDFSGVAATDDTSLIGRDPAYSPSSMFVQIINTNGSGSKTFFRTIPPYVGEFWAHWRWKIHNWVSGTGSNRRIMSLYDAAGNILAAISGVSGVETYQAEAYGDTTGVGGPFPISAGATVNVDVKLTVTSTITFSVYIDGTLVSFASAPNASSGRMLANRFQMDLIALTTQSSTSGGNRDCYFSEFIFATEDTRGMRLATLAPGAAGAYSEWTGGYAQIADNDLATAAAAAAAGLKLSYYPANYVGPASPASIRALVSRVTATKGSGGPQRLRTFLRKSLADYLGTTAVVGGGGSDSTVFVYDTNPITGAAWTTSDLSGLEVGFMSAA